MARNLAAIAGAAIAAAVLTVAISPVLAATAQDDANSCIRDSGDAAISACTRAIASNLYSHSDLALLYNNRGVEYANKGDLDRAMADYDQAIALDAKLAAAYNNRGLAYHNKGNLDHAIADFSAAIALDPKDAKAYNNRGFVCKQKAT
jgi:tetratricopeptide (TPR) repeat protein